MAAADVAFAAGFASVRQFNDTVREVFATTPSALRKAAYSVALASPVAAATAAVAWASCTLSAAVSPTPARSWSWISASVVLISATEA